MRVKGIQIGTEKYLVLDEEVYDYMFANDFVPDNQTVSGGYISAYVSNYRTKQKMYAHDFVMLVHGLKIGFDYDYVEFKDSFSNLIPNVDYNPVEILYPPQGKTSPLDCRFENLTPIKRDEQPNPHETTYRGITWVDGIKKWRAFLNSSQSKTNNTQYVGQYYLDIVAARCHDLACVENGLPDSLLNFDRKNYLTPDGCPVSMDSIQAIRCRNDKTPFGYEAAVFDDPHLARPRIVLNKFYNTPEAAFAACEKYIKAKFGPLSEVYNLNSGPVTSEKFHPYCQKCGKPIPIGVEFLISSSAGTLKTCEVCYSAEVGNDSDMPDPAKLLENGPTLEPFRICKKCGKAKAKTMDNFPTYKYKNEIRFESTCKICKSNKDKKRYRNKKNES